MGLLVVVPQFTRSLRSMDGAQAAAFLVSQGLEGKSALLGRRQALARGVGPALTQGRNF